MEVKFEESGTPLRRSKNRHGETCEEQLRRMCVNIADSITSPDEQSAGEWMEGTYDIRYLVDGSKRYLGAEILCAGGGPDDLGRHLQGTGDWLVGHRQSADLFPGQLGT